ncbi:hypothetical protein B0O99DRAFT_650963 [Bisporella sp. PMI_857]|nr:hypothetical protein B0O99DRAFT_650963 [Bisporella sp. PMI_857]
MSTLLSLPSEILLNIIQFLPPSEIVNLQHVSKALLKICRDDGVWREEAFQASFFLDRIRRRRLLIADSVQEPRFRDLARALATGNGMEGSRLTQQGAGSVDLKAQSHEKIRLRANWDPSYPNENINWYQEYIARNAPISTSWFEQPRDRESPGHEYLEVRGMALYDEPGEIGATMVVAPLDDGSICLWNINGTRGTKGSIVARSKSGLLSVYSNPPGSELPKVINTGVTECISVDSPGKRAYIAVQNGLVEVDLQTLSIVAHEKYPFSITAISEARHPTPITVGTSYSIYLHDSRAIHNKFNTHSNAQLEQLDFHFNSGTSSVSGSSNLNNQVSSPRIAPTYQSGPLSILHMPGLGFDTTSDIFVAGRFPSILNYDRRYFPKLKGTLYSGARLCSMTSLPYPFASLEKDLARRGELSVEQVLSSKSAPGTTLIACGEYNSKGSLEIYGLPSDQPILNAALSNYPVPRTLHSTVMKNRQTSSGSKLLSVASHGTRIVVSDGGGNLKWLERDGFSEIRSWNIAHGSVETPLGIFGTLGDSYMDSGSGDIVIKILENQDNLILWTGEKIGLLNFSSKPGFTAESFESIVKSAEEAHREREEHTYAKAMRRALEHQANEVRYVRGLGLGFGFEERDI